MRSLLRTVGWVGALVLAVAALAVARFPQAAPAQSLEDLLFQAFEITADLRPVPFTVLCQPECRITRFGNMRARTAVQFRVSSPSPVASARVFLDADLAVRAVGGVPLTFRRERDTLILTFNPPLAPGATGVLTFEYEGQPYLLFDDLILLDDGVLYPVLISSFGDISANRGTLKTTVTVLSGYLLASTGRMRRTEAGGYPLPFERVTVISAPFGRGLLGLGFPSLMMITEDAFTGGQAGNLNRDSFLFLLVAHEAAHTYFPAQTSGRGVASIWLSEGFAEYLGLMAVQAVLGQEAFRMLRFVVGDEAFRKILQTYAARFRGQSVRVDDFAQVAGEISRQDLSAFFRQWISERVLPDYTIAAASVPAEGGFRTTVQVRNAGTGSMPLDVLLEMEGGERLLRRVEVGSGAAVEFSETTPRRVMKVEADPEKWMLQSDYANDAYTLR